MGPKLPSRPKCAPSLILESAGGPLFTLNKPKTGNFFFFHDSAANGGEHNLRMRSSVFEKIDSFFDVQFSSSRSKLKKRMLQTTCMFGRSSECFFNDVCIFKISFFFFGPISRSPIFEIGLPNYSQEPIPTKGSKGTYSGFGTRKRAGGRPFILVFATCSENRLL